MGEQKKGHTFHIPVMGLSFTIDTPIKVAQYGISSVISIVDDILIEKMREIHCKKLNIPYQEISSKIDDFRAKRITAYLNLIDDLVKKKFEEVKNSVTTKGEELEKYIGMLPDFSDIKKKFGEFVQTNRLEEFKKWASENLTAGSIDVNIMTKLDKDNYQGSKQLPIEYNDAHAALRGFANSKLKSGIVLSAGMNPRLYSYCEQFDDFYPDAEGQLKKKIILKVSDYRSALIQGKFFAKKGLWVSEFRIESGLNCGGHAFATDGFLLGPILEEFKNNREVLKQNMHDLLAPALKEKGYSIPDMPMEIKVTAQGGVGTAAEHEFLLDHYNVDSVGWGTPFLLVPEATTVDTETLDLLSAAKENDLYLSGISPLGVPFNSLRNATKDLFKLEMVKRGRPGSSCPKTFLKNNKEYTDKSICTASRQYQFKKIKELNEENPDQKTYEIKYNKIIEKSCLCTGLANSAYLVNGEEIRPGDQGVSVCPGPNMAYFEKTVSLNEMVDHIYGKINIMMRTDRPNLFNKELKVYIDYFREKINEAGFPLPEKQYKYFLKFRNNLNSGIEYYQNLFDEVKDAFGELKQDALTELEKLSNDLNSISLIENSELTTA